MASTDGQQASGVVVRQDEQTALFARLTESPFRFDFFATLRRIEALQLNAPLIGKATFPAQEVLRLAQQPSLTFAPSNLSQFYVDPAGRARLAVRFMGLFGPHGALPTHITELAQERIASNNDRTLSAFADVFHHRMLSHFYRAWRQAQPTVNRDRPTDDRFMTYVGALSGHYTQSLDNRDVIDDKMGRFFVGQLAKLGKSANGLEQILNYVLKTSVIVREFSPEWLHLPNSEQTRLGVRSATAQLGRGAVLGGKVLDAQHHIGLEIGPLSFCQYQVLLPNKAGSKVLSAWLKRYLGVTIGVRSTHRLKAAQIPKVLLGQSGQLGWTTWLGQRHRLGDATDLTINHNVLVNEG